jgi:hypothetical protein
MRQGGSIGGNPKKCRETARYPLRKIVRLIPAAGDDLRAEHGREGATDLTWTLIQASAEHGAGLWTVWRHGGNANHRMRGVIAAPFAWAWLQYERMAQTIRQGSVMLVGPDGVIVGRFSAPRLRTRW